MKAQENTFSHFHKELLRLYNQTMLKAVNSDQDELETMKALIQAGRLFTKKVEAQLFQIYSETSELEMETFLDQVQKNDRLDQLYLKILQKKILQLLWPTF